MPNNQSSFSVAVTCLLGRAVLSVSLALSVYSHSASAQDVEAGRKSFGKCQVCHQIGAGARNLVGPNLNDLFGRRMGTVATYAYSPALAKGDRIWAEDNFAVYIRDPRRDTPGTKMAFIGITDPQEIKDLIAYLRQAGTTGK